MQTNLFFKMLFGLISMLLLSTNIAAERITISDNQIPYLSMVKGSASSRFLLVSNPKLCTQAPGPCRFLIESNYGHVHLNHLILPPKSYTQHALHQADCFAVYNVSAEDISATIKLLETPEEAAKYAVPGDLSKRVKNIQSCAKKAGK